MISLERLLLIALIASGLGLLIKMLRIIWESRFAITLTDRQLSIFVGLLMGLLVFVSRMRDFTTAAIVGVVVTVGFFLNQLVSHRRL